VDPAARAREAEGRGQALTQRLPTRAELDVELVKRRGLYEFVKRAWSEVEPAKFVDNWHIGAVSEHLQACQENQIQRLIINIPPGHTKSLLSSVLFPAWGWTIQADTRYMFASYDNRLALRDAVRMRTLVQSPWYQERWGGLSGVHIPHQNTRAAAYFKNLQGGLRFTTTIGGSAVGHHAHIQCVDDPIKPKDTQGSADTTRTILKKVEDWWCGTMATRIADPKFFVRIIVMQRLHDADLCGVELSNGGYVHLMLPARYEPARACVTVLGFKDPRTEEGELLWPARYDEAALKKLEDDLGAFASAQLQQDPVPTKGGVFERGWMTLYWSPEGKINGTIPLPKMSEMSTCFSWDMTFKKTDGSDYVAGGAWGLKRADYFLIDQRRARMTFGEAKDAVKNFCNDYPDIMTVLIEDKANGPAIIDQLKDEIVGIEPVPTEAGKEARAHAVSAIPRSGHLILPHPSLPGFEWVKGYVDEMVRFPKAPHDDQVDQTTQALRYLHGNVPKFLEAMAVIKAEREAAHAARVAASDAARAPKPEAPRELAPEGAAADLLARLRSAS
jgi:predicted phage terminase large subunit-like protein